MFSVPELLISHFRDEKVLLFVGSGCSIDAGFPSWEILLNGMQESFLDQGHAVNNAIVGYIERSEYSKAAKGFCNQDKELYRKLMCLQFDPKDSIGDPPSWLRYVKLLCSPIVVTTNWDNIIEDVTSYPAFHWQSDANTLHEYRQHARQAVFHIHGHIQKLSYHRIWCLNI